MSNLKGCYLHNTDDWKTPSDIFNAFIDKGYVNCFPYQSSYDELNNLYFDRKLFINPPYSQMKNILWWLLDQIGVGNKVALLIPARTDTKYFYELAMESDVSIIFITGRLKFNDTGVAPFPSILMLFNYHKSSYHHYFVLDKNKLVNFINDAL